MVNDPNKKKAQIESKFFESYSQMGDESAQEGNLDDAIEYYSLALEYKPNDNVTLAKLENANYLAKYWSDRNRYYEGW